jgi:hypothetical protein
MDTPLLDATGEEAKGPAEPPYSVRNEVRFFFAKGVPLGLSSVLEWGVPPWVAMFLAGHVQESAALQSALGYGRVFYNCTQVRVTPPQHTRAH